MILCGMSRPIYLLIKTPDFFEMGLLLPLRCTPDINKELVTWKDEWKM